jgi:hypothetical protein
MPIPEVPPFAITPPVPVCIPATPPWPVRLVVTPPPPPTPASLVPGMPPLPLDPPVNAVPETAIVPPLPPVPLLEPPSAFRTVRSGSEQPTPVLDMRTATASDSSSHLIGNDGTRVVMRDCIGFATERLADSSIKGHVRGPRLAGRPLPTSQRCPAWADRPCRCRCGSRCAGAGCRMPARS